MLPADAFLPHCIANTPAPLRRIYYGCIIRFGCCCRRRRDRRRGRRRRHGWQWDISFAKSLRHGVFAVNILPRGTTPHLVVLTDGVVSFPDQATINTVLERFRETNKIPLSFIQLGAAYHPSCNLGAVADTDLLHFLAKATNGSVLYSRDLPELPGSIQRILSSSYTQQQDMMDSEMVMPIATPQVNVCHTAFLMTTFSQVAGSTVASAAKANLPTEILTTVVGGHQGESELLDWRFYQPPPVQVIRQRWKLYTVAVDLPTLLLCRFRSGFQLRAIATPEGNWSDGRRSDRCRPGRTQVTVVLPFKQHVRIECTMEAIRPFAAINATTSPEVPVTRVRFDVVGPYTFQRIFNNLVQQGSGLVSRAQRLESAVQLKEYLEGARQADNNIAFCNAFRFAAPSLATIPAGLDPTEPVFVGDTKTEEGLSLNWPPDPAEAVNVDDPVHHAFVTFWTAVMSLTDAELRHCMPTETLPLLLATDAFHPPAGASASGSGSQLYYYCRTFKWQGAIQWLLHSLRQWCTFALLEDTYVKVCDHGEQSEEYPGGQQPTFCLVRVARQEGMCVVQAAFLSGGPTERNSILRDIQGHLFGSGGGGNTGPSSSSVPGGSNKEASQPPGGLGSTGTGLSAGGAALVTQVPPSLPLLVVKYPRVPSDFTTFGGDIPEDRACWLRVISYLTEVRRIYDIDVWQDGIDVARGIIDRILRLRMAEGFMVVSQTAGCLTLVKTIEMQIAPSSPETRPCLVQYVVFPPVFDDVIPLEIWVEPQAGTAVTGPGYLAGCTWDEIIPRFHAREHAYISAVSSHQALLREINTALVSDKDDGDGTPMVPLSRQDQSVKAIVDVKGGAVVEVVPFVLNIPSLLQVSNGKQLLYSFFALAEGGDTEQDPNIDGSNNSKNNSLSSSSSISNNNNNNNSNKPAMRPTSVWDANQLAARIVLRAVAANADMEIVLSDEHGDDLAAVLSTFCYSDAAAAEGIRAPAASSMFGSRNHNGCRYRCFINAVTSDQFTVTLVPHLLNEEEALATFPVPPGGSGQAPEVEGQKVLFGDAAQQSVTYSIYTFDCDKLQVDASYDPSVHHERTTLDLRREPLSVMLDSYQVLDPTGAQGISADLNDIVARSLVSTVALRLQAQLFVAEQDVNRVMEACNHHEREIDLTKLLQLLVKLCPGEAAPRNNDDYSRASVRDRFVRILHHRFAEIATAPNTFFLDSPDQAEQFLRQLGVTAATAGMDVDETTGETTNLVWPDVRRGGRLPDDDRGPLTGVGGDFEHDTFSPAHFEDKEVVLAFLQPRAKPSQHRSESSIQEDGSAEEAVFGSLLSDRDGKMTGLALPACPLLLCPPRSRRRLSLSRE